MNKQDNLNQLFDDFAWAAGIEDTFIPQVRPGLRRLEEYELIQHYDQWRTDFDRVADTGVRYLRWGIPWYRVQPTPDRWDWSWTDQALDYMVNTKGITPILDLMHYGTPVWMDNSFINANYPERVAEYTAAVAERYGSLLRYYTPFNEPIICAAQCGYSGLWPPYLNGYDGYLKVILAIARGLQASVRALMSVQPSAVTVQVEAVWRLHTRDPQLQDRVFLHNERQFLCYDLTTGRMHPSHPLYPLLRQYGVQEAELERLYQGAVDFDIFGANYYPWSAGPAAVSRRTQGIYRRGPVRTAGYSLRERLEEVWDRYRMPMMVTETSALGDYDSRAAWMDSTIAAVRDLRQQGLPILGYTWFPLFSMVAWEYRPGRRPLENYLIDLGLWDLRPDEDGALLRLHTPLVDRYRGYIAAGMPPLAGGERSPLGEGERALLEGQAPPIRRGEPYGG